MFLDLLISLISNWEFKLLKQEESSGFLSLNRVMNLDR